MTWIDIYAIAMLALPFLTGIFCIVVPHRRPDSLQLTLAAALAGGTVFAVFSLNSHACQAGNPAMQCLVGGACIWLIIAFIKSRWIRAVASILMVAVMFGLSVHYNSLVHSRAWVGNLPHLASVEMVMNGHLELLRDTVKGLGDADEAAYPEGWIRESSFESELNDVLDGELPYRVESQLVWHSAFTRLMKINRITQDFWYPGGRRSDAAGGIELRDVP